MLSDALACFFQTDIDYLFIGDFYQVENQNMKVSKKNLKI